MKEHKHAEVLRAIADGKEVQYRTSIISHWPSFNGYNNINPLYYYEYNWRIKPEPKPDIAM